MAMISEWKETESGTVPTGWRFDYLENLSTISSGTTPSRSAAERYYENGTVYWVKTMDLTNSDISTTEELVTKTALDETSLRVYPVGTVLIAMYGGFNQIGRTGLLKIPAAVNQAIIAIQVNPRLLVSEYLINILNYQVSYWKTVASSSRKDPNITSHDIKKFPIIFPGNIKEQQAIATALSDVDALITSLDRLVAKKRDIKQATMQQLLTGKMRLPGFSKKWEVEKLKEESELITKGTTPTSLGKNFSTHGVNFIKVESLTEDGHIIQDKLAFIEEETHKLLKRSQLKNNDILFSIAGALGRTAIVKQDILPANTNQALALIRLKDQSCLDHLFLAKYLAGPEITQHIGSINVQAAQANLSLEDVRNFEIRVPAIPEQAAIATVLSDMDAGITALEQKREKTRALKQGIMQELLTGKTRLL